MTDFLQSIDALIEERNLLKHPFYQAWNRGELSLEALQEYSRQYYQQVKAFPRYLGAIYSNCQDMDMRRKVLENIVEEDMGEENHPELWLRFAEGLGISRESVQETEVLPETRRAVDNLEGLARSESCAAAMASIYAYEAMVPEVAETKIEGLQRFYGIDDPRTLKFFVVHEQADREHREWDRDMIRGMVRDENDEKAAVAAASKALDALWTLLDGVHHRYVASAN